MTPLTLAQTLKAFAHDLAGCGFDAEFIAKAQLVALDRAIGIEGGITLSQEAVDVVSARET